MKIENFQLLNLRNKIPDDYQKLNKFLKFERETKANLIK